LPPLVLVGLLLPGLKRFPDRFPLVQQVRNSALLVQLLLAATGMFLLAHLLLFRLHLPNRYTGASLRIVIALAAGIALVILLDSVIRANRPWLAWLVTGSVAIGLLGYPATQSKFPNPRFITGTAPELYQFLAQQPRSTLVASLSEEADNLPTFAQRSTLSGREYGVPFQVGYYRQIRQRAQQMIRAQYSSDLETAKTVIATYGVDFWLLDRAAFSQNYLREHRWLRLFEPECTEAQTLLQQGRSPALKTLIPRCQVLAPKGLILLQASCIASAPD
jgi:hypothetical protein